MHVREGRFHWAALASGRLANNESLMRLLFPPPPVKVEQEPDFVDPANIVDPKKKGKTT